VQEIARQQAALSAGEACRLAELEAVVEANLAAFLRAAEALLEIRDRRLYRNTHQNFESYVQDRFGVARRTAYGWLEAARVHSVVHSQAQLPLSHLRLLAPLAPEEQRELAGEIDATTLKEARQVIAQWRRGRREVLERFPEPPPLPTGRFRCVVADPPWLFENNDRGYPGSLAADQYLPMPTPEIAALPVEQVAAADCHLYLWTTNRHVPDAIEVCRAWGFRYVTLLTWVKPGLGLGRYFRTSTEHVVFGVRGQLPTTPNICNWFSAKRSRHSKKPACFTELVERASPAGPRLELFARESRPGWTSWGNEVAPEAQLIEPELECAADS
jgi:N6-adenosine-specific RNA methylase IME4